MKILYLKNSVKIVEGQVLVDLCSAVSSETSTVFLMNNLYLIFFLEQKNLYYLKDL